MASDSSKKNACTVCGSSGVMDVVDIPDVPIHCNLLYPSRESALGAPRGSIRLSYCPTCGHVFNSDFDPRLMEYTQAYENSLHFSPRFQAYASELVDYLVEQYDLRNKDVIDIGCGKGDFLAMLCEKGENRGVGFDPSYVPEQMESQRAQRMKILQEFYSPEFSSYKADLVSCRHVLEHIQSPGEFLRNVLASVGDRKATAIFFEVPNVLFTLKDMGIWDLIYEHCSYFTPTSLEQVFLRNGFSVRRVRELYEGQFLGIEAFAGSDGSTTLTQNELDATEKLVHPFASCYRDKISEWKAYFSRANVQQKRILLWGAGSKGVTFLNVVKPAGTLNHIVDINPRKQGMYVAGGGQKIIAPADVPALKPDSVLVMNPIYQEEVRNQLKDMGVPAEVIVA